MANDFSANPWVVDTAGAAILWPSYLRLHQIAWTEQAIAGDRVIITDRNGKVVADVRAETPNKTVTFADGWINGLKVTQLDSGKLYFYIK